MAITNTHGLLSPTVIAREALRLLKNNLVMGARVYRSYESEFPGNPKAGGTVTIRKPVKFQVTKARTRTNSNITENSITLTVSTQAHVSWNFYAKDLTLSVEQYSEKYIRPAAAILANTIDADLCGLYDDVWNEVYESTGFVTPSTFMVLGKAAQRLDEEACPPEDRVVVFNPAAHWSMANALTALYQQEPGTAALRKGYLGKIANTEIYMDQNIKTHTVGQWCTATADVSTARLQIHTSATVPTGIQYGDTKNQRISIMGVAQATTVTKQFATGDVFTVAGVFAVNPMSGESTGSLRNFVVTADAAGSTDSTAANIWVSVQPDVINTGAYKTVSTVPAAGSVVTMFGNPGNVIPQNLAFHKNAFALVMVPLAVPDGVSFSSSVSEDGYSIRIVKDYNIDDDAEIIRMDVLYGVKTIYPELAVRIAGAAQ